MEVDLDVLVDIVESQLPEFATDPQYEVEVRIGTWKGGADNRSFVPGVRDVHLRQLIRALEKEEWDSEVHTLKTISVDVEGAVVRKRTTDGTEGSLTGKMKLGNVEYEEHGFRASVAVEYTPGDFEIQQFTNGSKYQREMIRTSYTSPSHPLRVDIGRLEGGGGVELEIEYQSMNPEQERPTREDLASFFRGVEEVLKMLYDTNSYYSVRELSELCLKVNEQLGATIDASLKAKVMDRDLLTEARNLHRRDLRQGGIVGGEVRYNIAHKTDGERRTLICCDSGCWLSFPPNMNNKLNNTNYGLLTVLDGELLGESARREKREDLKYWFLLIDALMIEGEDVRNLAFDVRQEKALRWLNERRSIALPPELLEEDLARELEHQGERAVNRIPLELGASEGGASVPTTLPPELTVTRKMFYNLENADHFFNLVGKMLEVQRSEVLPYKTDGLIFTPADAPPGYNPGTYWISLDSRMLGILPDVCKWKPPEQLTIDFLLKRENGRLVPYVMDVKEEGLQHIFVGDSRNKFDHLTMLSQKLPQGVQIGEGQAVVVECRWAEEDGVFRYLPVRPRPEKKGPNNMEVALDNWSLVHDGLTASRMMGLNSEWMREYHNDIKDSLLERALNTPASSGATLNPSNISATEVQEKTLLLDIGSGYGGDLSKWYRFDMIVAVEPNKNNYGKFEERLKSFPDLNGKVTLLKTGGENSDEISRIVHSKKNKGADVISMMNTMTFFWENEAKLQQLASTIRNCSHSGTRIAWMVMDGEVVSQVLHPALGGIVYQRLEYGEFSLTPDPNWRTNGEVSVSFDNTIVGSEQKEWLVRTSQLQRILGAKQLLKQRATDDPFMPLVDRKVSSLYSYGIWQLTSTSERKDIASTSTMIRPSTTATPSRPQVTTLPNLSSNIPSFPQLGQVPFTPLSSIQSLSSLTSMPRIGTITPTQPQQIKIHSIAPGTIQRIQTPPSISKEGYSVVRIGSVGDGSCLIHSVLQAVHQPYRLASLQEKVQTATRFRAELASWLHESDFERPLHSGNGYYTNWETTNNCGFIGHYLSQLRNVIHDIVWFAGYTSLKISLAQVLRSGEMNSIDFSLAGLHSLFNSNQFLGDEIIQIIADRLGIAIHMCRIGANGQLEGINRTHGPPRPSIFLLHLGHHYEALGLRHSSGQVITTFPRASMLGDVRGYPSAELFASFTPQWLLGSEIEQRQNPREIYMSELEHLLSQPRSSGNAGEQAMLRYIQNGGRYEYILYEVLMNPQSSSQSVKYSDPFFNFLWIYGNDVKQFLGNFVTPWEYYISTSLRQYREILSSVQVGAQNEKLVKLFENLLWISLMGNEIIVREGYEIWNAHLKNEAMKRPIRTRYSGRNDSEILTWLDFELRSLKSQYEGYSSNIREIEDQLKVMSIPNANPVYQEAYDIVNSTYERLYQYITSNGAAVA